MNPLVRVLTLDNNGTIRPQIERPVRPVRELILDGNTQPTVDQLGLMRRCRLEQWQLVGRLRVRFPTGGLEYGLLDFPTTLDGRVVYLCWKRGEPKVIHWHEVNGGFAARQPVTTEHAARMGTEQH